jgi:hypothetical protein
MVGASKLRNVEAVVGMRRSACDWSGMAGFRLDPGRGCANVWRKFTITATITVVPPRSSNR